MPHDRPAPGLIRRGAARLLAAAWPVPPLAAERFAAPAGAFALRVPLGALSAVAADTPVSLVLVARDGTWRGLATRRGDLPDDAVTLAFAGLGAGEGLALVIGAGPAAPRRRVARWAWWLLRHRPPIEVGSGGDGRLVPAGPVEAMHVVPAPPAPSPPAAMLQVDRFWRESGGCYLQGWAHAFAQPVTGLRFEQDEGPPIDADGLHPRPDLVAHYPMIPEAAVRAGFAVHLPAQAGSTLRATVLTGAGSHPVQALLPRQEADGAFAWDDPDRLLARADAAWARFQAEVNERRLEVLEIGARVVAMGSSDTSVLFGGAARYVGMDIHAAPGIDVVGDAHHLSTLVGAAAFDALFSSAVLEHLAMPWLAAAEMNRALRPGGLVFHRTHQCWPVHERPNDFFRFSDEALGMLFGPAHGFERIDSGMALPMAVYARDKRSMLINQTPLNPAFGMSWILARKVAELDERVDAPGGIAALSERYPRPGGPTWTE